jgi:regulator of replication initiation timing
MTLTKSQRSDIHRAAVEFNQTYLATFSQKVHFIIDLCEMRRQPSHLEEVNQALGLEIERLRDEIDHLRDELIAAQTTKD